MRQNSATFDQIQNVLEKAKSTVSHHLQILLKSNLIIALRHGKQTEYTLSGNEDLINLLDEFDDTEIADVYTSLGKPDRSEILELVKFSPKNIEEIEKTIKKATSTISYNLRNLQKNNLVQARKQGRATLYQINEPILLKYCSPFFKG